MTTELVQIYTKCKFVRLLGAHTFCYTLLPVDAHTYTHFCILKHTYTTHIEAHTQYTYTIHIETHTHAHTHVHVLVHVCARTRPSPPTNTLKYKHASRHALANTYICTHKQTCAHTDTMHKCTGNITCRHSIPASPVRCTHTHTHTHVHTLKYIQTHTYRHT